MNEFNNVLGLRNHTQKSILVDLIRCNGTNLYSQLIRRQKQEDQGSMPIWAKDRETLLLKLASCGDSCL
jgi:hypothetical protein